MSIIEKALDKRRGQAAAPSKAGDIPPQRPTLPTEGAASREVEIDFDWLRRQGIVSPKENRSTLAEEFRLIKRPLLNNAFGARPATMQVAKGRLIMVTSALPSEGKTFVTTNLALSIAMELERTVLLVDADVARPSIPYTLGFEADLGLMDVLTDGHTTIPDVLLRTNVDNLAILPAGRPHLQSTELLASSAMVALLDELYTRYSDRVLLFDSPPLLATSEAGVLAAQMGQVVLVVDAERTPSSSVERAMAQLQGCDVVLTALNRATAPAGIGYGGHYSGGRGYGGYGSYGSYGRHGAVADER